MRRIFHTCREFFARPFVRKAALFQVANGFASVLQALAGVVLARLLAPELFGQYALAFSVASVASVFLASGFQEALMPVIARAHARGDGDQARIGYGYWAKWIGASVVFVACVAVMLPQVTQYLYGTAAIGAYAAILLVASLISSSLLAMTQVAAQIAGRIALLSGLTLADMVVRYAAVIALVAAGWSALGASAGHLVGAVLMALLVIPVFRKIRKGDALIPSFTDVFRTAHEVPWHLWRSQGLWVWVDRSFGMLYQALPIALVGLAVTSVEVAYFKLAFGYLNTGMAVLGPLSVLLNTEFARLQVQAPHELRRAFIRMSLAGFGMAAGVTLFSALVGRWIFSVLYGPAYMGGVPLVYGLVLYGGLFGFGIALGPMWRAVGRVRVSVAVNVVVLGIGVPLGFWLVHAYGTWGGVVMVTLWYAAAHVGSFFYLLRHLNNALPRSPASGTITGA